MDEVVGQDDGVSPFRPSWIYGFNTRSINFLINFYHLVSPFRIPVISLFTLKDQLISFAGSMHVVIMDVKKKEQYVRIELGFFGVILIRL